MRLFIAIQLNEEMKEALLDLQDTMRELGVRGNYTKEENLHLTLAFIGEYGDPGQILDVIESIRFDPFTITLSETGSFHRLWWAGLEESKPLQRLVAKLRRELANAGIPFDRKKFNPHITLIREPDCRAGLTLDEIIQSVPRVRMTVDHISLMRSERGKRGMIYSELSR